jgi:uncharacterized membrane protein
VGINFEHPWALLALLAPVAWFGWEWWQGRRRAGAGAPGAGAGGPGAPGGARRPLAWLKTFFRVPGPFGWMRLLIILLLILALAGTGMTFSARNQAVMFVADTSSSTATIRAQMEDFIKQSISNMPVGDLSGVLNVAEDAVLEAPVSARPAFSGFTAVVRPEHTDLERGLRLGAALLPAGYRPRLVLLSDGKENVGNAMAEVQRLRQRGFTVDVVNFAPTPGPETLIKNIEAPGLLRLGEKLDATLTISASAATRATLRIYQDQALLESRPLSLQAGDQQVRVTMEGLKSGYHRIWAVVEAEKDTLTQNNEASVMVNVQGAPSVLVVEGFPGLGTNMVRALEATGMTVELRSPDALPTHGPQLARYASVVLVDVPAPLIPPSAMEAISSYVKQGGHGLVVVGGEHSYAMGGYAGTKLEEVMPVTMDVPQRKEKPPVAVALIIENFESTQKVNISKEAAKALVDMLTPTDSIMVNDACFAGQWVVPPQKVADKAKIKELIDSAAPCDPPEYMTYIDSAAAELKKIDAKIKHIVLAGDGDAQSISNAEYARRIGDYAAEGITLSAVHVNWQAPGEEIVMQIMASAGKGRYYLASNVGATPQIFLKEAVSMARPGIIEEDFIPGVLSPSPVLQGLGGLPMLRGYVATTPKPTGEVVLQSAQADPVLATWQTGLGRVAAYTSDSGGLWSEPWVTWEGFSRFWSNVVSWTMPAADDTGLRTMATVIGGKAHMTVQLPGEGLQVGGVGGPNSWPANITAGVIRPDGTTQVLPLMATAPGQYEGEIPAADPGPYLVKLSAGTSRQSVLLGETFVVAPYSPEFATGVADPAFMQRLAKAGGGEEISDPKTAFARNLPPAPGRLPLDHALLILALLLWPLDIAMRRLSVTAGELAEAWRRRREARAAGASATAAGAALSKMRERLAERDVGARAAGPVVGKGAAEAATTRAGAVGKPEPPKAETPAPKAPDAPKPSPDPPKSDSAKSDSAKLDPAGDGSPFTQRLLDARRKKK